MLCPDWKSRGLTIAEIAAYNALFRDPTGGMDSPAPVLHPSEGTRVDPRSVPHRCDEVKWQVVDDEAILVHLESGYYFSLNPVGLWIWKHADGETSLAQLIHGLTEEFDVDDDRAGADARAFLEHMLAEGLMTIEAQSSAS